MKFWKRILNFFRTGVISIPNLSHYQTAYYLGFILSVVISWSPLNLLAYLVPFLALGWFIVATKSSVVVRNTIIWFFAWFFLIGLYMLFNTQFVLHSAVLAILTYGTFAFIIVIPTRFLANAALLDRMINLACWVIVIEASLGIMQAIYGSTRTGSFDVANGDFVEGTIHPGWNAELAFSNPMFAVNIAFLLIAILPFLILKRQGIFHFLLGIFALVLASVLHVLIFLLIAGSIAFLIYRPRLSKRISGLITMAGIVLIPLLAFVFLSRNLKIIPVYYEQLTSGQFQRSRVVVQVIEHMPEEYPLMPLVGLGPGQFSSRAAMIGTGLYFGGPENPRPLPLLPQTVSEPSKRYLLNAWIEAVTTRFTSSTKQPLFSWLSLYSEWGLVGVFAVFAMVIYILMRLKIKARSYPQKITATAVGTGVLFLLLLGAQENYWEVPQAIFVGCMLLQVMYANVMYGNEVFRVVDAPLEMHQGSNFQAQPETRVVTRAS